MARQPTPGEHIWTLSKDSRVVRCELRNHSAVEAGWDVQLLDCDGLLSTTRYPLEAIARASRRASDTSTRAMVGSVLRKRS